MNNAINKMIFFILPPLTCVILREIEEVELFQTLAISFRPYGDTPSFLPVFTAFHRFSPTKSHLSAKSPNYPSRLQLSERTWIRAEVVLHVPFKIAIK